MIKGKIRYIESALRDLQAEGELQGQDINVLAKQVYSYIEGAMAQARIADDPEMLRGAFDSACKLLGVRPRAAKATAPTGARTG